MKMFRKLIKNEEGNYAAILAIAALPIMGAVGLSVDYSNVTRLKTELRDAADSACVPVAKMYLSGDYTDAQVYAAGKDFFDSNFVSDGSFLQNVEFQVTLPNATGNTEKLLRCVGKLTYKTIFGPVLAGLTRTPSSKYVYMLEESTMKMKNVAEIALVMDASGSMSDTTLSGGTRMTLLKAAAKDLVKDLVKEGVKLTNSSTAVKFSVVPFSASVNVGADKKTETWMDQNGISPIHHENLNWGTMNSAASQWKSIGTNNAKLDSAGKPLTRFTILDNLKFADGGTEAGAKTGCKVWEKDTTTSTDISTNTKYDEACAVKDRTGTLTYLYPSKSADRATLATKMGTTDAALKEKYVWKGCVEARPYPYNLNDTVPTTSAPGSYFVPMVALDEYNSDRYGDTKSSSTTGGESSALNNWWPDPVLPATDTNSTRDITKAFNGFAAASSFSAAWKTSTGRARQSDANKYYLETPYLLGSTSSSTSTSSSDMRKGQWHYFKADVGVNTACTTTPITPLTGTEATVLSAIDALQPTGNTNVTEGLAWGWRTISQAAPFTEGVADTNKAVDKVIIVFTDGANTYSAMSSSADYATSVSTYAAYGYTGWANNLAAPNNTATGTQTSASNKARIFQGTTVSQTTSNYSTAMITQMGELCTNIKTTDKVLLMTVALDLDKTITAENQMIEALKACSGDSRTRKTSAGVKEKMFWNACTRTVSDGSCTTLDDTFKQIKDELSNLRFVG